MNYALHFFKEKCPDPETYKKERVRIKEELKDVLHKANEEQMEPYDRSATP